MQLNNSGMMGSLFVLSTHIALEHTTLFKSDGLSDARQTLQACSSKGTGSFIRAVDNTQRPSCA